MGILNFCLEVWCGVKESYVVCAAGPTRADKIYGRDAFLEDQTLWSNVTLL